MRTTFLRNRSVLRAGWVWGLVLSLGACSWGGDNPTVAGHLAGGKPVGLFLVTTKPGTTARYYFSPTGVAYKNPWGLSKAALDTTSQRRGSYRVAGNTLSIDWLISPPTTSMLKPAT
ncbi:hypothetical protein GKZ68_03060 [Hymenobacter sp. BRD128]|uniref:hypothetical protein n=1 Tax=Hymenobacter sp. BRD128 TaxID=2675878 RepID=UPI001566C8CB|nr:hypothetical protein [Hymenobacter sp. BRD128]QKG55709.1 hypothetical protein GKZ68_03060 [Hymenobacter sp. BRD128]